MKMNKSTIRDILSFIIVALAVIMFLYGEFFSSKPDEVPNDPSASQSAEASAEEAA